MRPAARQRVEGDLQEPETYIFEASGGFLNSRLPLLVYRAALPANAEAIERRFAANGWSNAWRDGIFHFHHFHSTAHEVLGVARGRARVAFGGPDGKVLEVQAGDVIVIPAGVGHCNLGDAGGLLIVGAYPGGAEYDLRRGDAAAQAEVERNLARVPLPQADPVAGVEGPLLRLWRGV
jgi:uncharacterized protein YjlB